MLQGLFQCDGSGSIFVLGRACLWGRSFRTCPYYTGTPGLGDRESLPSQILLQYSCAPHLETMYRFLRFQKKVRNFGEEGNFCIPIFIKFTTQCTTHYIKDIGVSLLFGTFFSSDQDELA